ncbi:MAG: DUF6250 domain-containing protein [Kiritimatiellales bacterium]
MSAPLIFFILFAGAAFGMSRAPGKVIAETFDASWTNRWAVEGDSVVTAADGQIKVEKKFPEQVNTATIWLKQKIPADFVIELTAEVFETEAPNAANLNLIFSAHEADDSPVQFTRSGDYPEYHKFPNYIFTLVGGIRPGHSRVRRNPGFNLLSDRQDIRSEPGRVYRIKVVCNAGRIQAFVDDIYLHDVIDPQPLPGGRLALRTWNSTVAWRDIKIRPLNGNEKGETLCP